jgi:LmbE family N-acetylglucosaminyl deacetylase
MVTGTPNRIDAAAGTREAAWEQWLASSDVQAADTTAWSSVVVVAAHPDDEVLGVGGILALLAASGCRVRLVAATDGERSHPGANRAALARIRRSESAAALSMLGAEEVEVVRLGMCDSGLGAAEDELAGLLARLCCGFEVCLAPWENDAHADHEAAGRAALRAHDHVLRYPIWMWHWAAPADPDIPWGRAVRVAFPAQVAARKAAAIRMFVSQLTRRPGRLGPVLTAEFVAHFTRQQEVLFR